MAHPGPKRTHGPIATRFAWENMKHEIAHLSRNCHGAIAQKSVDKIIYRYLVINLHMEDSEFFMLTPLDHFRNPRDSNMF